MKASNESVRICRWCGFFFEGNSKVKSCPECNQESDGRHAFSIGARNAADEILLASVPYLIAAVNDLQKQVADLKAKAGQ